VRLQQVGDDSYGVVALALEDNLNLCEDEQFGPQPVAASCSGTLIGDDLVLTAGHCVSRSTPCTTFNYVFDYHYDAPGVLAVIDEQDVYSCSRVLLELDSQGSDLTPDFAVVQLDRPVEGGRRPATLRTDAPLDRGEAVAMIGFGSGLPAKIDAGASVAAPPTMERDFFIVNLDAFEGHSGSGIFDAENRLAGILLGGRVPDYVESEEEGCYRVNLFADAEAGEVAHDIASIIGALCGEGLIDGDPCARDACGGEPCGEPIETEPRAGGSGGVVPAESAGCSAARVGVREGLSPWLFALMGLATLGLRRRVV
jgi:V8-like Glu-specific endopeptidase